MRLNLTLILLLLAAIGIAQTNSGVVTYKEVINTKPDLQKAEEQGWAEWASMVPDSVVFHKKLLFNETTSSYTNVPMEENPDEQNMVKMMMRRYANANNETYVNTTDEKFVEKKDFMGKPFLIKGKPEETKWKMTGEIKQIMGYPCLKATFEDTTGVIDAWFTTEIAAPTGPEKYGNLPGLILELTIVKEKRTLTAVELDLRDVKLEEFKEPNEGKEVTREEYHKIVKEKMEEMRKAGGFGGMGRGRH
jgi:GLPGLI family protein